MRTMKAHEAARTSEFLTALYRLCRDHGLAVQPADAASAMEIVPFEVAGLRTTTNELWWFDSADVSAEVNLAAWTTIVKSRATSPTLDAVAAEMLRARAKFPRNRKMLAALMEEVGEIARALLQRQGRAAVQKECIQVAATALRIFEEGDADFADEEFEKKGWGSES